jgi:hypothetical protein
MRMSTRANKESRSANSRGGPAAISKRSAATSALVSPLHRAEGAFEAAVLNTWGGSGSYDWRVNWASRWMKSAAVDPTELAQPVYEAGDPLAPGRSRRRPQEPIGDTPIGRRDPPLGAKTKSMRQCLTGRKKRRRGDDTLLHGCHCDEPTGRPKLSPHGRSAVDEPPRSQ